MGRVGKLSTTLSMNRVGNSAQRFPMGRVGKLNTTLSSNSMHRFLRVALQVALETQHNAFYESRWKLSTTLSYGSRWKTQHNAFLWVALENSTQRFPMGRVVGWAKFYRGFVVIPTDLY